jgi:hypothetical protein
MACRTEVPETMAVSFFDSKRSGSNKKAFSSCVLSLLIKALFPTTRSPLRQHGCSCGLADPSEPYVAPINSSANGSNKLSSSSPPLTDIFLYAFFSLVQFSLSAPPFLGSYVRRFD